MRTTAAAREASAETTGPKSEAESQPPAAPSSAQLAGRHLRFGWWAMLAFVSAGIGLEALHGFKAQGYLGVGHETRRLMWTLAHAHGVGLSLLHIGCGATLHALRLSVSSALVRASHLLTWGSVCLPLGFALGGLSVHEGDPGLGIALVPIGAIALWLAVLTIALCVHRHRRAS